MCIHIQLIHIVVQKLIQHCKASICQLKKQRKNLNMKLPYAPAIPPLDIDPKELNTGTPTDIYTYLLLPALFIIATRWKQPKCSSDDEKT